MTSRSRLSAPIYHLKRLAKRRARETGMPLHAALDRVAREEGFGAWSLMAARHAEAGPARRIFSALRPGELVLLAARPGHGKTLLGIELIGRALAAGRWAAFFSLEWTEREIAERMARSMTEIGQTLDPAHPRLILDASDDISARHIIGRLAARGPGAVVVIDYLQRLDQDRRKSPLADQVAALAGFAAETGAVIALISQIDRRFEDAQKPMPGLADLRLPNPVDLGHFAKAVFLNDGRITLDEG